MRSSKSSPTFLSIVRASAIRTVSWRRVASSLWSSPPGGAGDVGRVDEAEGAAESCRNGAGSMSVCRSRTEDAGAGEWKGQRRKGQRKGRRGRETYTTPITVERPSTRRLTRRRRREVRAARAGWKDVFRDVVVKPCPVAREDLQEFSGAKSAHILK